jgi:ribosomal subunit interface protein
MRTIIHAQNISLTNAIRAHLDRRLAVSLQRFEARISLVEVYIKDINGSDKGVDDKSVLIKIHVPGMAAVIVENTASDLYTSINIAARRSKRALKRALRRQQRIERQQSMQLEFDRLPGLAGLRVNALNPIDKP